MVLLRGRPFVPCPLDLNDDGMIDVNDVLELLSACGIDCE